MGWWSRLTKDRQEPKRSGEENLLVISDIHLGEDILIEGPEHLNEYIRVLNRGLAEFVAAHCKLSVDGRRWHLVINGDMFDFIKVSLRPEPEEAYRLWTRSETNDHSQKIIPNTAENVVWKLKRILEVHRPLFKELAAFLLEGNRLTIIEGNHDAEVYFPEVRKALRESIVRLAEQQHQRERREVPFDSEALGAAVRFRVWFEGSPGRYHIEHGHQYDEYCSFEYQLAPFDRKGAKTLATPLSHRAMPYFAEMLGDFSTHGFDDEGKFVRLIRKLFSFGPRMIFTLVRVYFVVMVEFFKRSGGKRRQELEDLKERHRTRMRALADESAYGYATLQKLDRLKAMPAEYSLLKMIHVAYLDRLLVGALMLVGLLPALFMSWLTGLIWCGVLLGVGGSWLWISGQLRQSDIPEDLRTAASQIAGLTGVRYVIFGHSHVPELVNLRESYGVGRFGESAFYLNSGSWVTREILLGEEGMGMTYVEITSRGAALKRWRGAAQKSALLASTDSDLEVEGPLKPALSQETEEASPVTEGG